MGNFFQRTLSEQLLPNAPIFFDWLFDDDKFKVQPWDKNLKTKFTNKVRKLDGFGASSFRRKTSTENYPKKTSSGQKYKQPFALFSSGGSLSEDFIRHIRNGIAHGNAQIYKVNDISYIEITDWGTKGQTAFIAMPVTYLDHLYQIYKKTQFTAIKHQNRKR